MHFFSKNLSKIKISPTIAVSTKAQELRNQGRDIISLGMGEPDFDTPSNVKDAAIKAIIEGKTKYTAVDGIRELKDAIINKLLRENNIRYDASQITVSTGAKQVIYNALASTLNPEDEVIIPVPYWVSYPDMVLLSGGKPVIVESNEKFKITPEILEKYLTKNSKWLILNSPSNPTGAYYNKDELKELSDLILSYQNLNILSDDIYEHLLFDNLQFSNIVTIEPKLKDRVLIINGVSKAHSMTGWRIGYGASGNKELIKSMSKIQSQSTSCASSIGQWAAVEALSKRHDYIKENKLTFQKRRDLVVNMLNDIKDISCKTPEGAFYVFPSCNKIFGKTTSSGLVINNSNDFATYLLEEASVAIVPGIAFGLEGFFRISYAASEELLKNAINRINSACKKLL